MLEILLIEDDKNGKKSRVEILDKNYTVNVLRKQCGFKILLIIAIMSKQCRDHFFLGNTVQRNDVQNQGPIWKIVNRMVHILDVHFEKCSNINHKIFSHCTLILFLLQWGPKHKAP